ncbi:PREDICTED: uncharacterized protein LOC109236903 [Nicotiana attenuata]|uniref:uncharacterized protein LOC109236903 n=1 Tax=Nicotiana attenuata TaxID=49451 RepID=UPI0009048A49|nr:PREDICTED: uncharacterized protein LOC109236903 [Nicotiana attenuata]
MYNSGASLFGLLETKIKRSKAHRPSLNLCEGWSFTTNLAQHPKGKIWLLWKPLIFEVDILKTTDQLIHSTIKHRGTREKINVTMIYAYNDIALRRNLWKDIEEIYKYNKGPWAVMGDFNNVLNTDERIGSKVIMAETKEFRQYVDTCCLQELKSTGAFYTWNNKQSGKDRVMSRIDRVLVNFDWMTMLPASTVHYMTEGLYDHSPAIISWDNRKQMGNKHFKYFNMWSMDPDFKDKVAESWSIGINGTKMYQIVGKLNRLEGVLKQLNRTKFSNIEGKTEQAKKDLKECQQHMQPNPLNQGLIEREQKLASNYRRYKEASDQFLWQKSKVQWLKQGNKNNKYFHSYMKARRDSRGFCGILFKLARIYYRQKRSCLQYTSKGRQLGNNWKDLKEAALEFFESGKLLKTINRTVITIIPKSNHAETAVDFRPIACCNTVYKVMSKMLCNRLQTILPDIISENQSAFVAGRTIMQNILICQDLVRLYKRKATTKSCLIKIDLKKAYDSIEWEFVEEMLHALNFPMKFIRWIMDCISTPQYTVAINGGLYRNIKGKRGLRHGDPISPLLFVICIEYFSRIMKHVTQMEGFRFHTKCRSLQLNHLCFADGVLLFCKGEIQSVMLLLRGLQTFTIAFGLTTNAGKSNIFAVNMEAKEMEDLCEITGYSKADSHSNI